MISNPLDGLLKKVWTVGKSGHDGSNMGGCAGTLIANNFILTSAHCLLKGALPFACDRVPGHVGDLLDIDRFSFVINEHQIFKDPTSKKSYTQSADDEYDIKLRR